MRLSNDDKKRALSVVAECPFGRSGTLRTTREGKSPAESGTVPRTFRVLVCERIAERFVNAVPTSGASFDAETGSRSRIEDSRDPENLRFSDDPVLNKRGASSPERGRAG
jgi:hypothetical protein